METCRKQSTRILFAAALVGAVMSAGFSVILDETQRHESVPLGSSLELMCRLKMPHYQKFRLSWHFSHSGPVRKPTYNLSAKVITQNGSTEEQLIEEIYSVTNVTHEHSGWYFCKAMVEIPVHTVITSNETHVNITTKNLVENTTNPSLVTSKPADPPVRGLPFITWWMWIIVGASAFVLLVLLVICILLRRRCHKSRDPEPIYLNTRPMVNKQPSPRPDNLKMAPASQHLRTPSPGRRYEEGNRRNRR